MEPILRMFAELALFLEFADADELDRDLASKMLESVGGAISDLSDVDLEAFRQVVRTMADEQPLPQHASFLRSLAGEWAISRDGLLK